MLKRRVPRFNFHRGDGYLMVFKDHQLQLKLKTENPLQLEKYLRNLLPNDYIEWLEASDVQEELHLSGYIINLCCHDEEVASMFSRCIVKSVIKEQHGRL